MYNKLYMAIFGAVVMLGYQLSQSGPLGTTQYIQLAGAGVGAFLVWMTANGPRGTLWGYAKAIALVLSAGIPTLVTVLPSGLNAHEIFTLLISGLTALGVYSASGPASPPEVP